MNEVECDAPDVIADDEAGDAEGNVGDSSIVISRSGTKGNFKQNDLLKQN